MELLSAKQVLIRIVLIILTVEFLIIFLLGQFQPAPNYYTQTLISVGLLLVIALPGIYYWVIRPFILARDEAIHHISQLAFTDPLTQLANRRLLTLHLEKFIARCKRNQYFSAILLIDLNKFKPVNDEYGHDIGDAVLIEVGARLQAAIRTEDVAARLGGDEFVVLLEQLDSDRQRAIAKTEQVTQRLIEQLMSPIICDKITILVNASIGIRLIDSDTLGADSVIKDADTAMYRAKQHKDINYTLFESNQSEHPCIAGQQS